MTGRIRNWGLTSLGVALLWCMPAAGASAATCTGTPHAVGHNETSADVVDVTCDTAIANGSITIGVNRGADSPTAQVANGSGSFTCGHAVQPPGSEIRDVITCSGSMSAGATATVKTEFNPGACDGSPAFAGQLTVAFGDGTSFGPSSLAAYDCGGGGGGGGGSPCDTIRSGHDCDPGGVFAGDTKKPPKKASVKEAQKGLRFELELGVQGKVVTTIEVKDEVVGKTTTKCKARNTNLEAKLSRSAVHDLKGHKTNAVVHVEVIPNARIEGFDTHGREYFKLTLTG